MNRRKPLANWQDSAQFAIAARMPFAAPRPIGKAEGRAKDRIAFARTCQDCYPSILLWPVRNPDGPSFWAKSGSANFRATGIFPFSTPANPLWMGARIQPGHRSLALRPTMKRGSLSCLIPSPHWPPLWFLPGATARSIPIVQVLAHLGALPSGQPRATIWPKAPLSVACLARLPAIRACAADLTMPRPGRGAAPPGKAIRGRPRVALPFQDPAEGRLGGTGRCSRRS